MLHLDPSQKRNVLFTSAGTVSEEIHCPCIAVILCTGDGAEIICGGRRISLGENDVLTVALRSGSVTGTGETVAVFLSPDAETPALPELTDSDTGNHPLRRAQRDKAACRGDPGGFLR